ncbi:MAG: thermonuclease family protein [Gammaproteobacteria bacterium]
MLSLPGVAPGGVPGGEPPPDPVLPATLVKVVDGDTIKVRLASGPITVRLHGIDSPERKEALGSAATKVLRNFLGGEPLQLEVIEQRDAYDRLVAKVLVRGRDVNARMVESGYAWAYRRYLRHEAADEAYCRLEAQARAAGRGLWGGEPAGWEPPWSFRSRGSGRAVPARSYATETVALCIAAIGRNTSVAATSEPGNTNGTVTVSGDHCAIKGNISRQGERWFCSPEEAERAGWRASGKPGSAQLR